MAAWAALNEALDLFRISVVDLVTPALVRIANVIWGLMQRVDLERAVMGELEAFGFREVEE